MQVYRIAKTSVVRDLSGMGAFLYGSRWTPKGVPVVYAAETTALATLEVLVHVDLTIVPANRSMATIEIPDSVGMTEISEGGLPNNWRQTPAPSRLARIGKEWADKGDTLLLRVPSAVVPIAYNVLINPRHEDIDEVKILKIEVYKFDPRLLSP
jgi:RES domain-containing protein